MPTDRPDYTGATEIQGVGPAGSLLTLAVDADGQLYALVVGTDGVTARPVAVDASGQIIMVPRGQSGNYLAVDTSGYLSAILQGTDAGAVKRPVLVDANGQVIMVPRGQSGNYLAVDSSGYLTSVMKGMDGVTLRTVAVDASGKILGVLQGDYAGALKTLAVDAQGRMLAVLTDPEDVFGNPNYMGAAELAARLGSIDVFERRGQVILLESFEHGYGRWGPSADGTGVTQNLSTFRAKSGSYSFCFAFGAGTATFAEIATDVTPLVAGKMGVEFSFYYNGGLNDWRMYVDSSETGGDYIAALAIDLVNQRLLVRIAGPTWIPFATNLRRGPSTTMWTPVKMVVDLVTHKYVRCIINQVVYDLSAYSMSAAAAGTYNYLRPYFNSERTAGQNPTTFIDDVIITQNEA